MLTCGYFAIGDLRHPWVVAVAVRVPMTKIETTVMAVSFYSGIRFQVSTVAANTASVESNRHGAAHQRVAHERTVAAKPRQRGVMTVFDTLRAAAHALSDRTHRGAHAPALAGLLQNRADDMEGNIAIWQRTGQDIPALVEKHYGVYLTVATAVLSIHVT